MTGFKLHSRVIILLGFGLFSLLARSPAQTASGMKARLNELKPLFDKEEVKINEKAVWSNASYSAWPVTENPSKEALAQKGAIIGVIYVQRKTKTAEQLQTGTYALRLKGRGETWTMEFLDSEGKVALRVKAESIAYNGPPLLHPTVRGVSEGKSKRGEFVAVWCWDNFCCSSQF